MYEKRASKKLKNRDESSTESITKIENLVRRGWQESSENEARSMISLMVKTPSAYWLDLLAKAEVHQIPLAVAS